MVVHGRIDMNRIFAKLFARQSKARPNKTEYVYWLGREHVVITVDGRDGNQEIILTVE